MKEILIIIAVLLLVFIPNIIFKNFLDKSGSELIDILESMNQDIQNEQEADKQKSEKLKQTFLEKEEKWILIVDHEILDEVENSLQECIAFYNAEDKMEYESSFGKLKNHIEDLTKREETTLRNIL